MSIKTLNAVALAVGAVAAVPVAAGPVTVSTTASFGSLISGASNSLSFNFGAFLAGQGLSASNIVSGGLVVYGFSEASYAQPAASPYSAYTQTGTSSRNVTGAYYVPGYSYSYSCGFWGWSTCYASAPGYTAYVNYSIQDVTSERTRDIRHIDSVADQLTVHVGSSSGSDTADQTSSTSTAFGAAAFDGQYVRYTDNYGNRSYDNRYSRERDVYEAVFGDLEVSMALDAAALVDVKADAMLNIDLAMNAGQMSLRQVRFDFVINTDSGIGNNVPEPGTLLLASAALSGLALASKRRRKGS